MKLTPAPGAQRGLFPPREMERPPTHQPVAFLLTVKLDVCFQPLTWRLHAAFWNAIVSNVIFRSGFLPWLTGLWRFALQSAPFMHRGANMVSATRILWGETQLITDLLAWLFCFTAFLCIIATVLLHNTHVYRYEACSRLNNYKLAQSACG